MSIAEFFIYVYNDWGLCAFSILLALVIYFFLYKRFYRSILDPLSIMILGSCMGFGVVIFLFLNNLILPIYFYSYLSTQILFYFGFRLSHLGKKVPIIKTTKIFDLQEFTKCFYIGAVMIDVCAQLVQYKQSGIPLFMSSRLNAMADANGAGILTRFIDISRAFTVLMSFFFLQKKNSTQTLRIFSRIYLFFVVVCCFLSGARSSLLVFATSFFFYVTIFEESQPYLKKVLRRYEPKIIIILGVFVICVNTVKYGNVIAGVGEFGVRLLCSGDAYFYAYPNQLIEQVDSTQPFKSIFSSFLGFFRIYPYEELPNPIGLDLYRLFSDNGDIGGPNARHNIVSYLYFGLIGGAIFSFILGTIAGFFRRLFFSKKYKSLLGASVFAWLYSASCSIETDVNSYLFNINSFIVVFPIIFLVGSVIYISLRLSKMARLQTCKPLTR